MKVATKVMNYGVFVKLEEGIEGLFIVVSFHGQIKILILVKFYLHRKR